MLEKEPAIYEFDSGAEGKHLLVFGAVHGNETCGPRAIERIRDHIEKNTITLKSGKLTMVPVCNPKAYEQGVRYVERNLNRYFYPKDNPQTYEDHLDHILCPLVEKCDFLLDLHSYTSPGAAFAILEDLSPESLKLAGMIEVPHVISGHSNAINQDEEDKMNLCTVDYARKCGASGLTLECGNHDHPRAADIGFQAILNLMKNLGMADIKEEVFVSDLPEIERSLADIKGVFFKDRPGSFVQDWRNLDKAAAGTIIARYEDGAEIAMPYDGYIILPKHNAVIGHEWFFWGVEADERA